MTVRQLAKVEVGKRARRSRGEWLEEVVRWRRSGRNAEDYARVQGLNPRTLTFWASRLRRDVEVRLGGKEPSSRFLPVRVADETSRRSRRVVGTVDELVEIEVVLTNGRRVRVSRVAMGESLARLLDVVEGGVRC